MTDQRHSSAQCGKHGACSDGKSRDDRRKHQQLFSQIASNLLLTADQEQGMLIAVSSVRQELRKNGADESEE